MDTQEQNQNQDSTQVGGETEILETNVTENTEAHGNGAHQKNTGMAIVAYILFFIPLLTDSKNDPFVKFHVKQGLIVFILFVISFLIQIVPILGFFIGWIISIGALVLLVIGIINALNGKEKELPLVGKYAKSFKI